ncbi:di-heme oxidoreductase family protein [Cellvibrio japonicus]|uniref:Predicted thiol oxidoreductase n=1 Tax=Cellvibrio japonicus (strain Ueda107) TaxID=498211 RepID=B3PHN2_CELJU|nr:di-heme oxidoredictase family protein [Cellvibrio japonicus]ACE84481.1 Predicted thiol oxidoreductase [Cellvibrio japonicus Ueda107]
MMEWRTCVMVLLLILVQRAIAEGTVTIIQPHITHNQTREAYGQPFRGLNREDQARFFRGRHLFRQSWVIAPASDTLVGLGPLYNRIACVSCHPKNGRGRAPEEAGERMQSMLVRLSVPGKSATAGPKPHPVYGTQLNEEGVPGVPGEGRAQVVWEYHTHILADGTPVRLRKPSIRFSELGYGKLKPVLTSARIGPAVFGLGLLEAVSDEDLLAMAQQPKPDGITGKVNRVWDIASQQTRIGRFGAKANVASLRSQIAEAMHNDLGITSNLLPRENCQPRQHACRQAPSGGSPELSDTQLDDLEFYFRHIAVPAQRNTDATDVISGEKIFADIGCAICHKPQLQTAKDYPHTTLANLSLQPYTDLLLHDMGEGLADQRPDFLASGREWRTPPLWGIGLTESISEYQAYLHDGRAQTLTEAILWHGGEAKKSRDRYQQLPRRKREQLEQFLLSL